MIKKDVGLIQKNVGSLYQTLSGESIELIVRKKLKKGREKTPALHKLLLWPLRVSSKFIHQEIKWNLGILLTKSKVKIMREPKYYLKLRRQKGYQVSWGYSIGS